MRDRFQVTFLAQMRSVDLRVARRGSHVARKEASRHRGTHDVGRATAIIAAATDGLWAPARSGNLARLTM
jgi:hypothetical protein